MWTASMFTEQIQKMKRRRFYGCSLPGFPEEAIRLFLSIRAIRQERLQDISDDDIGEEGIWLPGVIDPRFAFSDKWDMSLSKPMRNRYSWDDNPMVWVLEFDRVSDTEVEHDGI